MSSVLSIDPFYLKSDNQFILIFVFALHRFYLVSDGIPLIIVGITAAFDLENYGSKDDAL